MADPFPIRPYDRARNDPLLGDDEEESPEECGDILTQYLLLLKSKHEPLGAKQICIIAYWAIKSKGRGTKLADLSFRPDDPSSGHYQRQLDTVMGTGLPRDGAHAMVKVPVQIKADGSREVVELPGMPIHEVLANEVAEDPDSNAAKLVAMHRDAALPPCYYTNPVVVRHGLKVQPYALYVDGVAFAKKDSVLAFFVYLLSTGRRHNVFSVRKSEYCPCGCRGWCTLFSILIFLRWGMDAAAEGTFPDAAHDGDLVGWRSTIALFGMDSPFCCIFFKGDWGEMQPTIAFPTFSHNYHSCTICFSPKEALQDYTEFTCAGCPYDLKTYAHVDAACRDCEIVVVLTEALHSYIRARLSYDKRDKGVHGRYLCECIPATADHPELLKMDRLEPSAKLTDIGDQFDKLTTFPFTVVFWRVDLQTCVTHRNPLWNDDTGFTHDRVYAIDGLHTISLGVVTSFIMFIMHWGIELDLWETSEAGNWEVRCKISLGRISAELTRHYDKLRKQGVTPTDVTALTSSMFSFDGGSAAGGCGLKASEANYFLSYVRTVIVKGINVFPGAANLLRACDALMRCQLDGSLCRAA